MERRFYTLDLRFALYFAQIDGSNAVKEVIEQKLTVPADGACIEEMLNSSISTSRLEQAAALRACGIGDHVDLPPPVVCGIQSTGKS